MQEHRPQSRSLFNLSPISKLRRAQDEQNGDDKQFHDFLLTEQGRRLLASVIQKEHAVRGKLDHTAMFSAGFCQVLISGSSHQSVCHLLL